jgi:hypothetical protein
MHANLVSTRAGRRAREMHGVVGAWRTHHTRCAQPGDWPGILVGGWWPCALDVARGGRRRGRGLPVQDLSGALGRLLWEGGEAECSAGGAPTRPPPANAATQATTTGEFIASRSQESDFGYSWCPSAASGGAYESVFPRWMNVGASSGLRAEARNGRSGAIVVQLMWIVAADAVRPIMMAG